MRTLLLLTIMLLSIGVQGQNEKESTLQVTGSARITVKPDIGVLNIQVSEVELKMNDAIKSLGDKSNHYLGLLKTVGFSGDRVKTTKFAVSKNRVYRDNNYVDSGYVASQEIRLEFSYDQEILSKILNLFSKSDEEVDFSFDFKLSEGLKAKVQKEIIELAVKDAKEKAGNITAASNLKLVKIQEISYSRWGHDSGMEQIERQQRYASAMAADGERVFNFTPDDLIFRDTITIYWVVEEK